MVQRLIDEVGAQLGNAAVNISSRSQERFAMALDISSRFQERLTMALDISSRFQKRFAMASWIKTGPRSAS